MNKIRAVLSKIGDGWRGLCIRFWFFVFGGLIFGGVVKAQAGSGEELWQSGYNDGLEGAEYLPSHVFSQGYGSFHSRLDSDFMADRGEKILGGASALAFAAAVWINNVRSFIFDWANGISESFDGIYPIMDGLFASVANNILVGIIPGILILWLTFVAFAGAFFGQDSQIPSKLRGGTGGNKRFDPKPLINGAIAMMLLMIMSGAAQTSLKANGVIVTDDITGVINEDDPLAGNGKYEPTFMAPSWMVDTMHTGIRSVADGLTASISGSASNTELLDTIRSQSSGYTCDQVRTELRQYADESHRALNNGAALPASTVMSDALTDVMVGVPWAVAQFGDIGEGRRIDCWVLANLSGLSSQTWWRITSLSDYQDNNWAEAAWWDNSIAGPFEGNNERDRFYIAMFACEMSPAGFQMRNVWAETTRGQNAEASGIDPSEACKETILSAGSDDGGMFDLEESQARIDQITPNAQTAKTVLSSLHGESELTSFVVSITATISSAIVSLTLAPAALIAALSLAYAIMLWTLAPFFITVGGVPGKQKVATSYAGKLFKALAAFSAVTVGIALLAMMINIMLSILPPANNVFAALQIALYPIVSMFFLHRIFKTLGVASVLTPGGLMALATGGGVAAGAIAGRGGRNKMMRGASALMRTVGPTARRKRSYYKSMSEQFSGKSSGSKTGDVKDAAGQSAYPKEEAQPVSRRSNDDSPALDSAGSGGAGSDSGSPASGDGGFGGEAEGSVPSEPEFDSDAYFDALEADEPYLDDGSAPGLPAEAADANGEREVTDEGTLESPVDADRVDGMPEVEPLPPTVTPGRLDAAKTRARQVKNFLGTSTGKTVGTGALAVGLFAATGGAAAVIGPAAYAAYKGGRKLASGSKRAVVATHNKTSSVISTVRSTVKDDIGELKSSADNKEQQQFDMNNAERDKGGSFPIGGRASTDTTGDDTVDPMLPDGDDDIGNQFDPPAADATPRQAPSVPPIAPSPPPIVNPANSTPELSDKQNNKQQSEDTNTGSSNNKPENRNEPKSSDSESTTRSRSESTERSRSERVKDEAKQQNKPVEPATPPAPTVTRPTQQPTLPDSNPNEPA